MSWLNINTQKENPPLDSFLLFREKVDSEWQLFYGNPFTEWGCKMMQKGLLLDHPEWEFMIVKDSKNEQ